MSNIWFCDVTSDESVKAAVAQVLDQAGRIDLLVNNAGVGLIAGAEESSLEQAKSLFDVNLFGVIRMTKAVLPIMRRQGSGRIVNISSVLGLIPAPFMALYAASKHALEGYSESLDHEIRGSGIRVVLVEPAYTRTSFEGNVYQADQQLEVYQPARSNAEGVMRDAMKVADSPELVASAVVKASTAANPQPALHRGQDGAPDQSAPALRSRGGVRQESAEADALAGIGEPNLFTITPKEATNVHQNPESCALWC